jgi:pyruvate dehydrogenase E2 component (dihydrolipoamide acetyltransferase)
MPVKILMPALSPTMTEGTLATWKKKEGDVIKAGMVLAEIETDKATMEVEAVDEGILGKILIAEGSENVAVNTLIAVLLEDGEDASSIDTFVAASSSAAPSQPKTASTSSVIPAQAGTQPVAVAMDSRFHGNDDKRRLFVSPIARRLANENHLDLSRIAGTGPHGRIVRDDVLLAIKSGGVTPRAAAPAPVAEAPKATGPDAKQLADLLGIKYREEKVTPVRKVIAQRLTESKQTVPHFYLNVAVNIDPLMKLRAEINARSSSEAAAQIKLSVNDFVIKAVALALKKVPAANASWNTNSILYYETADISVAVATPTGLITPIIKAAEAKSLADISTEMKDLAQRAKDNKLKPTEFQGGTFSLSNLGMFGIKQFDAIINPPQGCILAVGAGEPTPIVMNGEIKIATIMNCNLSVDHRVVDGAVGAEYLQALKGFIENPEQLLG